MKILHTVESYLPALHGMQKVVQQLSEQLHSLGHDVTIATKYSEDRKVKQINGITIVSFRLSGNMVEGIAGSEQEQQRYIDFVKNGDFDIVANFAAQQWATDLLLPHLVTIKAKKIFIPTGFSKLTETRYNEYYQNMREWILYYDSNVFLSSDYQDIDFARKHGASNIKVIANAASYDEFNNLEAGDIKQRYNIAVDDFLILTVGSHTGSKGHSEAMSLFKRAKLHNVTLLVIGNNPLPLTFIKSIVINTIKKGLNFFSFLTKKKYVANCYHSCSFNAGWYNLVFAIKGEKKRIVVKEMNRADTLAAYAAADLFLFPSNIECSPLVLFEAMAAKTPFLSSAAGNSVEIAALTNGGIIMPTIKKQDGYCKIKMKESVDLLENFCKDDHLRATLQKKGYDSWINSYTWERIAIQYEHLYLTVLSK